MAAKLGLDKLTARFADELSRLLNTTVCDGIRLTPVTSIDRAMSWVGYEVRRGDVSPSRGIPIGIGVAPTSYLHAAFTLSFDAEGDYVQVQKSTMGICIEPDLSGFLFHYDYDRGKPAYADAHLQIPVTHPSWESLRKRIGSERTFERLHLPLGPRRYRPTVEDLVEFIVSENLAEPRDDQWGRVLREARASYEEKQLRAAIRRDIKTARDAVDRYPA